MSKTILPALTVLCMFTIAFALWLTNPTTDYNRQQAANLRRYQQAAMFDVFSFFYPVLLLLLVIALGAVVVIAVKAFALRYTDVDQLHEQRLQQRDIWFIEHNNRPEYPNLTHMTYAPRTADSHNLNITQHHKTPKALTTGQNTYVHEPMNVLQQVPTFKQALADTTGAALVLGYDQQAQPIHGTLDSLYSFGIGGMSGSGKSSTAVWLLAQSVLQGARLIVIDPHKGNPDSLASKLAPLASSYLCKVASSPDEMLHSVRYSQSIFNSRKSGESQEQHHVIVVCDEWLACMRGELQTEFQKLAESISQEGRKYGVIGCFLSQKWSIQKSGDMRDTLTSHIICRTRPNLARQQTGLLSSELPSDVMSLDVGQFYLLDTLGEIQKLTAPYVSDADLRGLTFDNQHSNQFQSTFIDTPLGVQAAPDDSPLTVVEPTTLTAEQQQALELFKQGKSLREIVRELHGVSSGSKYNKYLGDFQQVLREKIG